MYENALKVLNTSPSLEAWGLFWTEIRMLKKKGSD